MKTYQDFLASKNLVRHEQGIEPREPHEMLFPFQRDIVKWALRRGRACIWADCGLGKTFMQLAWADQIPGMVLILAPLAVAQQTVAEGRKIGVNVSYCRDASQINSRITITNYEMLQHFEDSEFEGIILDESSILKSFTGKFRNKIIDDFASTPFRLACTATPAPNDHMELGNHAEFVGAMSRVEMLSMFFVHDGGDTSKWRLKGHAQSKFWEWVCSWAVMIRKPSDLGYKNGKFTLPPIHIMQQTVETGRNNGYLFPMEAQTLSERIEARRDSVESRVAKCAEIVNATGDEPWVIWCNLNSESAQLEKAIEGAVQVVGSEPTDDKAQKLTAFSSGEITRLVSKPSIAGHGMNWQHCSNVAFVGLSDSWEQYYQAVRRCWRFGQTKPVNVHIITASTEGQVLQNIQRKERDALKMASEMVSNMKNITKTNLKGTMTTKDEYKERDETGDGWTMMMGDCVTRIKEIKDESIGFSVFSPPFASLYTYSASDRDMGNSKSEDEFFGHFKYLISELLRVTQRGRLASVHCMNMPTQKVRHGQIGIQDFRGDIIRAFTSEGWIYHSEVCVWKDPVTAMQRTKALGLLHKQMVKDSCMSRQGIPDYVCTFRKPGENANPVSGELGKWVGDDSFRAQGKLSIDLWQRYASPIWMDINPSNTLQKSSAREEKDERHICPLQLDVIERCLLLWSNPGDVVFSPFAGIGSEGVVCVREGRRFVGIELKQSYYDQATKNLAIESNSKHSDLFQVAS